MSKELEVAVKAAKIAGETLEYHFETFLEHELKEDKSIVTKADLDADKIILKEIEDNFPDHNILSEEGGLIDKESDYTWLIDPLDGTTNFARGVPHFSTSIALQKNEEIQVSVVYNPITNSLFHAEKNTGTYWNEEKVKVSEIDSLEKSIITTGRARDSKSKEKTLDIYNKLYFKVYSQRIMGSSAIELAWVASGRLESFISVGLKRWDVAGGLLLVTEAGGKVTDFKGEKLNPNDSYFVASNGRIHRELLDILNKE